MAATKSKNKKSEPQRSDDVEVEVKTLPVTKLKNKPELYVGYTYKNPTKVLIAFEEEQRQRTIKLINKLGITFTRAVNDGLELLLTKHKIPKKDE